MPLMLSSSAAPALFTSTAAKLAAAYNMAAMARIFFNINHSWWLKNKLNNMMGTDAAATRTTTPRIQVALT
jgi:hypothetical protein